jgi:hypothetical protein
MFKSNESAILITLYEEPNVSYTSYTLTHRLNPTLQITSSDYGAAFGEIRNAIEELIVQGLVRGKRSTGANGIYFSDLKLTYKGEQTAIRERRAAADIKKQLPELMKQANAVAEEVRRAQEKK